MHIHKLKRFIKINYWIRKLVSIQCKNQERKLFKNSSKLLDKILEVAQNKFKKNINANIIREIEDKIHRKLIFLDCSGIILKGYTKAEYTFRLMNGMRIKFKIRVEEVK